jgi:hypothetical protein
MFILYIRSVTALLLLRNELHLICLPEERMVEEIDEAESIARIFV